MPGVNLTTPPDLADGQVMRAGHWTVPMGELEAMFQSGVDDGNLFQANSAPDNQSLRGRNFRSRAVTDVFRNKEDEPFVGVWEVSDHFRHGPGGSWVDIPGCCVRFFAREDVRSALICTSFEFTAQRFGVQDGRLECVWDQEVDARHAGRLTTGGFSQTKQPWKIEPSSLTTCFGVDFDRLANSSAGDRGWHEVATRVSKSDVAPAGERSLIIQHARASVSVILVYR